MDEITCNNEYTFQCAECQSFDKKSNAFNWSNCGHSYSKECAISLVVQHLTMPCMPYCIVQGCQQLLSDVDAMTLLPASVYNIYINVYTNLGLSPAIFDNNDMMVQRDDKDKNINIFKNKNHNNNRNNNTNEEKKRKRKRR